MVAPAGAAVHLAAGVQDDGWVRISVADTGIGIADEDLAAIFEPFRQVHTANPHQPKYPGTGLGLPLVKRSEEHTSEIQSLMSISYAVFCLKKKTHITDKPT